MHIYILYVVCFYSSHTLWNPSIKIIKCHLVKVQSAQSLSLQSCLQYLHMCNPASVSSPIYKYNYVTAVQPVLYIPCRKTQPKQLFCGGRMPAFDTRINNGGNSTALSDCSVVCRKSWQQTSRIPSPITLITHCNTQAGFLNVKWALT